MLTGKRIHALARAPVAMLIAMALVQCEHASRSARRDTRVSSAIGEC